MSTEIKVSVYFSELGIPKTGLSPVINIREVSTGSLAVDGESMSEVGGGNYKYTFTDYNEDEDYVILCDQGSGCLIPSERYAPGVSSMTDGGSMLIVVWFSASGAPQTGLSPTLDIYDLSDNSIAVNDGSMTEIGDGFYKYSFTSYQSSKDYNIVCDGGATLSGHERYIPGSSQERENRITIFGGNVAVTTGASTYDVSITVDDVIDVDITVEP